MDGETFGDQPEAQTSQEPAAQDSRQSADEARQQQAGPGTAQGQGSQAEEPAPSAPAARGPQLKRPEASGGKAVASLICGILAILLCPTIVVGVVLGVVALVLGILARKQHPEPKATAGIVCGVIGTVLSVLLLVAVLAFVHIAFDASGTGTLDSYVSEMQNATGSESDEEAARDAADEALEDATQPSEEAKSQAADAIDQRFSQSYGMSLADAGVDKDEVVSWMADDASYEIGDVVVTGTTATAKVTLTVRDIDAFEDAVSQQVSSYLELNGGNGATSTGQIAQQVAQYVEDAMDSTGMVQDTEYLVLDKQDNAWTVEQSSIDAVAKDVLDV